MLASSTDVAVVVVAYGAEDLLRESLVPVTEEFETYVVDNSRSDAIGGICDSLGARYMRPSRNLGFAAGVNEALKCVSPSSDVLLLNPDARIDPDGVRRLQEGLYCGHGRRAAVAPRLRRPDGTIERTSWPIPSPALSLASALGVAERRGWPMFVSGAVLMLAAAALADVGTFDTRFFLYAEESDWQLRALKRGWTVAEVPAVEAHHVGAGTSSDPELRERLFHGSAELFVRKWYGSPGWFLFRTGSVLTALRRALVARSRDARREHVRTIRRYVSGPAKQLPPWARRTS